MSLLMKALEKAAKDRVTTPPVPEPAATAAEAGSVAPAPGAAKAELSLEPLAAETPPLEFRAEPQLKPAPLRPLPARPKRNSRSSRLPRKRRRWSSVPSRN